VLLVIAYSRGARQSLRNICRTHDETVVRQFGRVALFESTGFAAFQALRLREKHGEAVQIERTKPFDAIESVPEPVRSAAAAYENREEPALPYEPFAERESLPTPAEMKSTEL